MNAALQTAILSTTAGHVSALEIWLPVFIAECRIQPTWKGLTSDTDSAIDSEAETNGEIHDHSKEIGLYSRRIDGTLRDSRGIPKVDLEAGAFHSEVSLRDYVTSFVDQQHDDTRDDEFWATISALLDLAVHKNPRSRVLEFGGDAFGYKAREWQFMLDKETAFSRDGSYNSASLTENAEFGRFVKIGKRELIDAGKLDMRAFLRKATFTAFDLSDLFYTQDPFHRLVSRAKQLVSRLEEAGATVGIICGDVSKITNVTAAASTCMATGRRIRSVIQAAMGLYEA
ncbi:polyketide synthase [Daldinia childiae]|uniref:polyketide synthase n=1 Tax=Daldinia childiae TaxID=326645 RepID=UPI001446A8AC|nr:polyketide synthase [Daldinia childiae]KAF3067291.1 polyketide synthase [Daldinia childiae]